MRGARHGHDRGMTLVDPARLTLDLERGADPIRGSIERPDGSRQPFWGWLQLMEEVRRAAAGDPSHSQATDPPDGERP